MLHDWGMSLFGGLLIGGSAALFLHSTGRVTGISGFVQNCIIPTQNNWQVPVAWVSGLALISAIFAIFDQQAFISTQIQDASTIGYIIGGFLVGFGTRCANGCTSGHGLCGLARLSKRSLVAVSTFMAAGFVTSTIINNHNTFLTTNTFSFNNSPSQNVPYIVIGLSSLGLLTSLWHGQSIQKRFMLILTAFSACLFAIGLILGGMTQRSNIVSFLNGFNWNPKLAFTLGGGLLVTLPAFEMMKNSQRPWLSESFCKFSNDNVDLQLHIGSWLFGIGWGIGGLCPGPAIAQAAAGMPSAIYFLPAMVIGMWTWRWFQETILSDISHCGNQTLKNKHTTKNVST